ncbi:MAG TPA: flagellar hook capping FlgD N-terminal domain-containing protein [Dongiaceae bacterium]|jgi:flagellar basal-body rod modification protein FlgD|nr:flagellar hook capping FlgD N-terminal domain-containing protein [Dongiaceae bacterium]
MTAITSATLSSSATGTSSTSSTSSTADTAYNTFLTLLTTQLQNQDPLNPTDPDQFTSELIQLAGVEQQMSSNDTLSQLLSSVNSLTLSSGVGYIGKTVEFDGSDSTLQNGAAQWNYTLPSTASSVTLTVSDASGNTLYQTSGDVAAGEHSFTWDGTAGDGTTYDSGTYTLTVQALDSDGDTISTSTTALGKVTGVDSSSGSVELKLGTTTVDLSDVLSITE